MKDLKYVIIKFLYLIQQFLELSDRPIPSNRLDLLCWTVLNELVLVLRSTHTRTQALYRLSLAPHSAKNSLYAETNGSSGFKMCEQSPQNHTISLGGTICNNWKVGPHGDGSLAKLASERPDCSARVDIGKTVDLTSPCPGISVEPDVHLTGAPDDAALAATPHSADVSMLSRLIRPIMLRMLAISLMAIDYQHQKLTVPRLPIQQDSVKHALVSSAACILRL
ncbi:unnamed protein product [Protopolystoma xenopodis]|uniref:Uncharacterized protein n=1 Tax=Protopolystoma xenopodis TaxID=117903 RepID=A0A3S5FFA0_9PLAT|nr:unnamed protein product [Protopolystoma xenopodis]